ncbi:MAG: HAD hydrolase family protein [Ruminococcus sp.]
MKKFPPIGQRIIKSSVSVALCMIVYYIRSLMPISNGIPFYSALAALWCMQQYGSTTKNNAWQRIFGTLTGAAFGLALLLGVDFIHITAPVFVYMAASAMIIPVIYFTVIMNKRNAAFFSCVVFLSIVLNHSFDDNPYIFVLNRVIDTFIGIAVGVGVNNFHLPVKHDTETLYISGIDDVLISSDTHSIPYSKVELNRLIRSGVKFSISTVRTPAELVSLMEGVELQLPVIVMDGAALYDIKEKQYIETVFLPPDVCTRAERIISAEGLHCFVNAMYDTTLLIFYGTFHNDAERNLFETHRHSLYRNYVRKEYRRNGERVLYLTVLAEEDKVVSFEKKLKSQLGASARITASVSEYKGFSYLKIFSGNASKTEMIKKLKEHTGAEKTVTFGSIKGEYDVYINDGGGNSVVKKLKKLYRNG